MNTDLITKYNQAVPRYTSYPAVPHWQSTIPSQESWLSSITKAYNDSPGLSLYIHLPFCEALCTYCGCNKRITKNHGVEEPYIESLLKEWDIYRSQFGDKPIIKEIHLGGGTPTFFSPIQLRRLISTILSDTKIDESYEFSFEAHPNSTTSEHLTTLYELGFRRISIGVQDISSEIMHAINRNQTSDEVQNLTKWSRALGYTSINYDIIYGLPFQKEINVMDTMDFIAKNRPDRVAFYSYAHVPWKSANQRAFTINDVPNGILKSELCDLGRFLLEQEGYESIGMDHFCLPNESLNKAYQNGKMHRNFMGYTSNYTKCSIALGASSISDSWNMYIQNEKNIEAYQHILASGKLPIIKGHQLSPTEQNMRQHILNLMCSDKTSWSQISNDAITITPYLTNLNKLAEDGLVAYDSNSIVVSNKGRFFIRNICAAIDPIFQTSKSQRPMFSKAI